MRSKSALAFIFLIMVFTYLILCVFSGFNYLRTTFTPATSKFDSLARYPYAASNNKNNSAVQTAPQILIERVLSLEDKLSALFEDKNVFIHKIAEAKKGLDKNIYHYNITTSHSGTTNGISGKRDTIVMHSDGSLFFLIDDNSISSHLSSLIDFSSKLSNEERQFLLFVPPDNGRGIDPMYDDIYVDYAVEQEKKIASMCIDNNTPYILYSEHVDSNRDDLFFRTDHHWLPYHGIEACKLISQWLNENGYHCNTDLYDLSNYSITENDNPMLGSLGKKATLVYTAAENMPVISPKYDSNITVFNSIDNSISTGRIENLLLYPEFLTRTDIYTNTQYYYYGNHDHELVEIHNNLLNDGKKILIIKNSFANCAYPFMCNMAEYVNVIDLRNFKGSLETFISEYDPDTVIVFYSVSAFTNDIGRYDLAFDFR